MLIVVGNLTVSLLLSIQYLVVVRSREFGSWQKSMGSFILASVTRSGKHKNVGK